MWQTVTVTVCFLADGALTVIGAMTDNTSSFNIARGFLSELLLSLPCPPTPTVVWEPLRQSSGATHTPWMALWAWRTPGRDAPGVGQRGRQPLP